MDEINIEDFMKVDLRIAKVKEAIEVPEADKLVKLILDVGELGEKTVFAGIKAAYKLEELIGNNPGQDPGGGLHRTTKEMDEIIKI